MSFTVGCIDRTRDSRNAAKPCWPTLDTARRGVRLWRGCHVWHKTADEILDNLADYCQRINESGH